MQKCMFFRMQLRAFLPPFRPFTVVLDAQTAWSYPVCLPSPGCHLRGSPVDGRRPPGPEEDGPEKVSRLPFFPLFRLGKLPLSGRFRGARRRLHMYRRI